MSYLIVDREKKIYRLLDKTEDLLCKGHFMWWSIVIKEHLKTPPGMITVPSEAFDNYTTYGASKFSISLQDLIDNRVTSSIRKQVHYNMKQNPVMLLLPVLLKMV